jgi:RHS repeat-associated protein
MSTSTGTLDSSITFFPYGLIRTGSVSTDKKFTGQRLDGTGLYYYGARYYDASIGRFISPVIREGLQAMMAKDERLDVVGDVPDGYDGLLFIKRASDRGQTVNVVLTETRIGERDGVQATRIIKDEFPEIAILVLTDNMNDSYVIDVIQAGAGGYIFLEDMTPESLLQSIYRVVEGGVQMKMELLYKSTITTGG